MTFWTWSRTAATNASADSTINWAEGQAPSSVNDSARAVMAAAAKYRDDIAGAIVTGGTSTAYTVTSYEVFDTLAHLNGQMIAFTPHTTNADTVTLNVDGLGAKPLRSAPSTEIVAGTLVQGTPYVAVYNNSDASFYLQGFYSSPYNVPFLGGMDYWDTVAPNSTFIFPAGQAISRTVYSRAFGRWGTTYGAGDGSTTFNVPDKTGRMSAMKESIATRLTAGGSGIDGATMGASGGVQSRTIAQNLLPNVTLSYSNSISVTSTASNIGQGTISNASNGTGATINPFASGAIVGAITSTGTSSGNTSSINGGVTQGGLNIMNPLIVCNYIIRIL